MNRLLALALSVVVLTLTNGVLSGSKVAAGGKIASRFTNMSDGTIRDNDSGLIWLKDANCYDLAGKDSDGKANWHAALEAAAALSHGKCGLKDGSEAGDWRLPTKAEWEAFMSTVYDFPALVNTVGDAQWSEGDAFAGVQSSSYWSSTEYAQTRTWRAFMDVGLMNHTFNQNDFIAYVWPVRNDN
jgi:hypothetical protein